MPFSTWSLTKLAEHLVGKGVVDDISHEGLRLLLREEGVSFQTLKTWKQSNDPDFEAKKNRILHLSLRGRVGRFRDVGRPHSRRHPAVAAQDCVRTLIPVGGEEETS